MAIHQQTLEKLQLLSFHPCAARTATGNGSAVDLGEYDGEIVAVLSSTAGAGTNPTLDIKFQSAATSNGDYTDISGATFTQVGGAASGQKITFNRDDVGRYIRIVYTIGGTNNPSFTFAVKGLALKKYG